jgi:V8-like Glu-specific endopeptidase
MRRRRNARALRFTAALLIAAGALVPSGLANAATTSDAVVNHVTPSDQATAASHWTPQAMRAAIAVRGTTATPNDDPGPPPGTPTATSFNGVPTVGALFFTAGPEESAHFCTASVVYSPAGNLLLTAAHCVSDGGLAGNLVFVPEYHDGQTPLGTWTVQSVVVAPGWAQSADPNLDFAFLTVAPSTSGRPLQWITGGNWLGVNRGYDHTIEAIGYPNTAEEPVGCRTRSFQGMPHQLQFNCHGYTDGTSGGPWLIDYNPRAGSGTIIGDIGGYHQGGDYEYTSYSPYFDTAILKLYLHAIVS